MKSILVMGGSDFIGSALAKYLIKSGYKVDIFTPGEKRISYKGFNRHLICDRIQRDKVKKILEGKKYEYIFDITAYTKEDVEILIDAIDKDSLKKYIVLSAGAVYKDCTKRMKEDSEKGKNENWGDYALKMKEAEDFVISSGIPYVIVRSTYIYGEHNNLYRETYFFDRIERGEAIPVPRGKSVNNQFIYIEDLVKVFKSLMNSSRVREDYNVTNPQLISWNELIQTCGEIIGKTPIIKPIDVNKAGCEERSYFPFMHIDFSLDIDKLIEHGIYIPNILLKEGLTKTYKWYKKSKPKLSDNKMDKIDFVLKQTQKEENDEKSIHSELCKQG